MNFFGPTSNEPIRSFLKWGLGMSYLLARGAQASGDYPSAGLRTACLCGHADSALSITVSQDGGRADSLTAPCDYGRDENQADAEKATKPTLPAN
jgi:hypothetical protein